MNDLDEMIKEMEEAQERAQKASDRADLWLRIALWVNLFNLGFQSCHLIDVLTH